MDAFTEAAELDLQPRNDSFFQRRGFILLLTLESDCFPITMARYEAYELQGVLNGTVKERPLHQNRFREG